MRNVDGFHCIICDKEHGLAAAKYTCPSCGGNLQVAYDYNRVKKRLNRDSLRADPERTIWRYLELLPVSDRTHAPPPETGWTPLYRSERLGRSLGLPAVYLKDDGRNPSASFKDRASAVVVARALESGETAIAGASTGNAASSLACAMGHLDFKPVIFVPRSAPAPKLAQLLVFGATVLSVDGTYDDAFDLCLKACEAYGWYNRNTGYNPFTREGKKTCAFELCEQLDWEVPDSVFVPVGDGNILSGLWKGFRDFERLGLIDKLPRLVAVQAEGSDAVCRAFESGGGFVPVSGRTVADSVSVRLPRDGPAAVKALRESGGFCVRVSDDEILDAVRELARAAAVFAEPAAAAAYAGLRKAAAGGRLRTAESVVALITGSGLKDVDSAIKAGGKPYRIEPDLRSLGRLAAKLKLARGK